MRRILKPTTIIPDLLYVPRAADRQLAQIIDDMGRPGYVLVARQMGKTNLLLHMKRRREEMGDVVVYVDLSQRFENARACFRHIIDIALETKSEIFSDIAATIGTDRAEKQIETALEFGQHLRLLTKAVPEQKLIVILDEVDSLINCGYGDVILSQVRSIYFARTNFAEYERITYVLSGVAEPTDLIKDKNVSPFNIGEKIYLSDFSREETAHFFERANLNVRKSVIDAVHDWTAGNPRMTWDICASIEQQLDAGDTISPRSVEATVRQLYLVDFDRPPIDHIRTLVASDNQLKSALISIRYGKGAATDARTKSRLYLAGITNSPAADMEIKNRIIDLALSDAWLSQMADSPSNTLARASEHFAGKRFGFVVEALRAFEEASAEPIPSVSRVELGVSLFNIDNFDEAAAELRIAVETLPEGELRTTARYYRGAALYLNGHIEESITVLEDAAEHGSGINFLPAKIMLAAAYYGSGSEESKARGALLRERLHGAIREDGIRDRQSREIIAGAVYNLAVSTGAHGDIEAADEYFSLALEQAPVELRPTIAIARASYQKQTEDRIRSLSTAAEAILEHSLRFSPDGEATMAFRERTLAGLVLSLIEVEQIETVEKVIEYARTLYRNDRTTGSILLFLARILSENGQNTVLPLLKFMEAREESLAVQGVDKLALLRLLASHSNEKDRSRYQIAYFSLFEKQEDIDLLPSEDAYFIVFTVQDLATGGREDEAIRRIQQAVPLLTRSGKYNWVIILLYFKMQIHRRAADITAAKQVAAELLSLENSLDFEELKEAEIGSFIDTVFKQARSAVSERDPNVPDPFRGIGRNQKVIITDADGSNEREVKFKTVDSLLRSGRLLLVRTLPR